MAGTNWRKIVEKLRSMDRQEFLDRSRQEVSKRSDVLLARWGIDFVGLEPRLPDASPGALFFSAEQVPDLLQLIRERLPEEAARIVARADRICKHHFDLLGYENLDYGKVIDWHRDVVHRKTAPLKPFHRVKYLDFAEVGDSKVTWELNRHQHLVVLAKAYRLTGEERYAREIHSQWHNWQANNPYPIGINWSSSLEVAFRSLSWIWVYSLLEGTPALGSDLRREWLKAQALNGRHIERYLSTYFSANTHLLGEAVALFFLGVLHPEISSAKRWKSLGWKIILEQSRRQVNSDGWHFEQSTYYHVYAIDFFLHAALLAEANGQSLSQELMQTVERMLNALFRVSLTAPPPRIGDDDGGRLFDAARNRSHHLLDPLAAGAILFKRADFKQLVGGLREETIWLLGRKGINAWDELEPQAPKATSTAFEAAGIYVLAAGKSQVVINGAPSVSQSYGHSHADALSVCLQSGGRNLLIDSGTCEYVGDSNMRNLFRGTAMHNTLRVDGKDQEEPVGPFSWKRVARAKAERWTVGESFSLFVGSHDGYQRLSSPVEHRRWVIGLSSSVFLVRDVLQGSGDHGVDISWHLAQDLRQQDEHVFVIERQEQGLAIVPVKNHGWEEEMRQTLWSPVYGRQGKTAMRNFGARVSFPADFATLLVPFQTARSSPGDFAFLAEPNDTPFVRAYRYENLAANVRFFFGSKDKPWQSGNVASDAEFVCLAVHSSPSTPDVILCNGSYVDFDGVRLLATKRGVAWCELIQGPAPRVFGSDLEAVTHPQIPCPS
ncbi:MAG: alginate lyase family protein [Candidatus Sulfotelmatobacter sp.]|jgi:hypothetical protein